MNSCPTCQQRIRSDGSGLESELTTWLEAEAEQHRKTRNEWFLKIEKLEAERDEWKWEYHNSCKFRDDLDAKIEKLESEIVILREALEEIGGKAWICGERLDGPYKGLTEKEIANKALTQARVPLLLEIVRAAKEMHGVLMRQGIPSRGLVGADVLLDEAFKKYLAGK